MASALSLTTSGWIEKFLVDRRVPLSFTVFTALLLGCLFFGGKPCDVANPFDPHVAAGITLMILGAAIRSWAAGVLHKGASLATTGPYGMCRHPLYLGSFLMILGVCAIVNDLFSDLVVLAFVLPVYFLTMRREEKRILAKYGQAWHDYRASVPRLFPRLRLSALPTDWSFAQWRRNREYQAILTALAGLGALKAWHVFGL